MSEFRIKPVWPQEFHIYNLKLSLTVIFERLALKIPLWKVTVSQCVTTALENVDLCIQFKCIYIQEKIHIA